MTTIEVSQRQEWKSLNSKLKEREKKRRIDRDEGSVGDRQTNRQIPSFQTSILILMSFLCLSSLFFILNFSFLFNLHKTPNLKQEWQNSECELYNDDDDDDVWLGFTLDPPTPNAPS